MAVPIAGPVRFLSVLDWQERRNQYDERVEVHDRLLTLFLANEREEFAELLVGVTGDGVANYSAHKHTLGPRILDPRNNAAAERRVFELAEDFRNIRVGREVPRTIKDAAPKYLSIGVGSEASCLMNPDTCWVVNTRTIWMQLIYKHNDLTRANRELALYRDADESSEMAYDKWVSLHSEVGKAMIFVAQDGDELAARAGVEPGSIKSLWADAIASGLYEHHHK